MRIIYSPKRTALAALCLVALNSLSSQLLAQAAKLPMVSIAPAAFTSGTETDSKVTFGDDRAFELVIQSRDLLGEIQLRDNSGGDTFHPFAYDSRKDSAGQHYYHFSVSHSKASVDNDLIKLELLDGHGKSIGSIQIKVTGAAAAAPAAPAPTFVFVPNDFYISKKAVTCPAAVPQKCEDKGRCKDVVVIDACCCPPVIYYPYAEDYGSNQLDTDCSLKTGNTRKVTVGKEVDFVVQNLNPYKYDINVTSKDSMYFQLSNPILNAAFSSGAIGSLLSAGAKATALGPKAVTDHQQAILDRLKAMNAQLSAYITYKQTSVDCADLTTLETEKNTILNNIHTVFKAFDPGYANDLNGYVLAQMATVLAGKSDEADQATAALVTYNKFISYSFQYTYKVLEVPNADLLTFSLTFSPKKDLPGPGINVTGQNVKLSVVGGWRVNASAGVFTTFGSLFHSPGIYSINYAFSDSVGKNSTGGADSILSRKIVKEKVAPDMGVGAFVHFYKKSSTCLNWGGSIGAGLTISSSPQIRYFIGPSVLIGNTTRMVITGGLAFGTVSRLSERYTAQFPYVNTTEASVQTTSTLGTGFFIAVTYNLPFVQ